MKTKLIFTLLILLSFFCRAQNQYEKLISKADSLYKAKDYQNSSSVYNQAFKIEEKNNFDLYNAACAASLAGENKNAFKYLNLSIDNGWTNFDHLKTDTDLASLHNLPEWKNIVKKVNDLTEKIEANYNKPAKLALEQVYETDQGIRLKFVAAQKQYGLKNKTVDSLGKLMNYHDSLNTITVTNILDKFGWLGKDKAGNKGNLTLFLVVQHADLKTQQKYLPMLRKAVKNNKATPSSLALLEDRVALREGKKQIYGSQISQDGKSNRTYIAPLLDPDKVDERRKSVGLQPLADYVKQWGIIWDVEAYKKQLPEIEKWEKQMKY